MISDKQRREVAARLRKTHGIMAFVDALGIDFDSDWCWTDVSRRVSDLIDPTCRAVHQGASMDDELVCSECGASLGVEVDGERMFVPNFCSCCGARVVSYDD